MILVDLNQIMIGSLMVQVTRDPDLKIDEFLVRHLVLNSLRYYRKKFYEEYGEFILCCDSKHYWRKDVFPNYKANRKKDRASIWRRTPRLCRQRTGIGKRLCRKGRPGLDRQKHHAD